MVFCTLNAAVKYQIHYKNTASVDPGRQGTGICKLLTHIFSTDLAYKKVFTVYRLAVIAVTVCLD